jgi:transcription termination factor Rho
VLKETLIGKILEHQTVKADPSLDFKMESPLEDDKPKELVLFPPKGSYSKAKSYVIIMNRYCCYRVESEGRCSCRGELSN